MAHDMRFNHGFTDQDQAMLVAHYASVAHHPQHCYHTCGWLTGHAICNLSILGNEFSEHLRTDHAVIGPGDTMLRCCWIGCNAEMKKESLMRHVQERHLEWRYPCPNCHERFTRNYTRDQHVSRRHSGS